MIDSVQVLRCRAVMFFFCLVFGFLKLNRLEVLCTYEMSCYMNHKHMISRRSIFSHVSVVVYI